MSSLVNTSFRVFQVLFYDIRKKNTSNYPTSEFLSVYASLKRSSKRQKWLNETTEVITLNMENHLLTALHYFTSSIHFSTVRL